LTYLIKEGLLTFFHYNKVSNLVIINEPNDVLVLERCNSTILQNITKYLYTYWRRKCL